MVAAHGSAAEKAGIQGVQLNDRYALTDQNIRRLSTLLNDCKQCHSRANPQCSLRQVETIAKAHFAVYQNSGLPSRLIDVEMKDRSKVRLVDVKTREQYLALSYRWGESQRLVTHRDKLETMRRGFEIDLLSKTIQDAILLCRELKIRYLWVDALCIIQKGDNGADWSLEFQKMSLIYAQAFVTVAVASSDDSNKSFLFAPRVPFVEAPFRKTSMAQSDGALMFAKKYHFFEEEFEVATYENPLAKRGWVMQERLFSRRTIHFTGRQVYWECASLFCAEDGSARTPLGAHSIKMAATFYRCLFTLANHTNDIGKKFATRMLLKAWSELLTEYSELELTFEKDRLPGIRGAARMASLYLPGRYLSGLWEHTLSSDLLWVPKKRPMALCQRRWAPTWSWANNRDAILSRGGDILGESESCIVLDKVLNFETPSETLVLSGQIQCCEVSLTPEAKPTARCWKDPPAEDDDYMFWPQGFDKLKNEIDNDGGNICHFDVERGAQTEFLFLAVECSKRFRKWHCRGLLLNRENGRQLGPVSYSRVGIGWASHRAWHDGPTSTISLR
ncbi:hypothetical protein LTS08_006616 [Lithohypha guttulata]|nr:hypothetical protein LTR51_000973 [Lithohypha guttulata]KAK5097861.1 hypothetical protein LTS08_006616 [Lithohypha guttulata]KAK5310043.1 hypothetical protein LTR70_009777 [Exophiala xenobiotica]